MNKNRMQKLAGINEATLFKNGKFKLDRYEVEYGGGEIDRLGNWCLDKDVKKLEQIASELYDALSYFKRNTPLIVNDTRLQTKVENLLKKASSI